MKAGSRMYYELTDSVQDIWVKIDEVHTTPMLMDEVSVAVEMLFNLLSYKDMQTFLGVGYKTSNKVRDKTKSSLLCMIRDIDAMVNEVAGTETSISREEFGKIVRKPLKTKRSKRSKKELSKAQKEVERHRKEKEEARKLLRRKIAEVRATIEAERAGGLA